MVGACWSWNWACLGEWPTLCWQSQSRRLKSNPSAVWRTVVLKCLMMMTSALRSGLNLIPSSQNPLNGCSCFASLSHSSAHPRGANCSFAEPSRKCRFPDHSRRILRVVGPCFQTHCCHSGAGATGLVQFPQCLPQWLMVDSSGHESGETAAGGKSVCLVRFLGSGQWWALERVVLKASELTLLRRRGIVHWWKEHKKKNN